MASLLSKWFGKHRDVQHKFYNPLEVKMGDSVSINEIDYSNLSFRVEMVQQWKRDLSGGVIKYFTDYRLKARQVGQTDAVVRLRYTPLPVNEKDKAAGITHTVMWMELYREFGFDQSFDDYMKGEVKRTNTFTITPEANDPREGVYTRCYGLTEPYYARTATLKDADGNGKVVGDEVQWHDVFYYDFERPLNDGGRAKTEWCFVETDEDSFTGVWLATEIEPTVVMKL